MISKRLRLIILFLILFTNVKSQDTTRIINTLPDTIVFSDIQNYENINISYGPGGPYESDTIYLYYNNILISKTPIPDVSISSISESNTTPLHSGSGYSFDNGNGVSSELGYYLKKNSDGSFQLNDWSQTISGDIISKEDFGNYPPVEFEVLVADQDSFYSPNLFLGGEFEVYVNGRRLSTSAFNIDSSGVGVILNTGLSIGDYLIIDID